MIRALRRALTGTGRWVRPAGASVAVVLAVSAAAAGAAAGLWAWGTRAAPPARTMALAASVLRRPLPLDSALDVTWAWSVGGTDALADRWLSLVAPELPPGLCLADDGAGAAADGSGLGAALRRLDAAVQRGAGRDEIERRLRELRGAADGPPGSRAAFLARYALARGYAAAGDWATAADVLEPVFDGWLSPERVPDTNAALAPRQAAAGRIDRTTAVDAVHARHLAGTVAFRRGEPEVAVAWFRRAINAVHHVLVFDGRDPLGASGHYQRIPVTAGATACAGGGDPLTSLDAYAGLVAAYMADEDFRDPGALGAEVRRSRLDIDPGDPFRPVLLHAARTGGDPARTPIPEHLLWAASNLQRVYHHNRLRPDARLEVTRAVLLLHLTRESRWAAALRDDGGAEVCTMLGGIAEDLRSDAAALELGRSGYGRADSARAAVAVQAFGRLEEECAGAAAPAVDDRVRSAWIRLGGPYLTRGLGGTYEEVRRQVAAAFAASGAPASVLEQRVALPLERARAWLRVLRDGRVPPELPADLAVEPAARLAGEWWDALFADVAAALLQAARDPSDVGSIRAGEVDAYLEALFSAARWSGARPSELWAAAELDGLARTGGSGDRLTYHARWWIASRPAAAAGLLALAVLAVAAAALLVHVNVWRYRATLHHRFWAGELAHRRASAG